MSGIAGIVHFRGPSPQRESLLRMAAVLQRGDETPPWIEKQAGLVQAASFRNDHQGPQARASLAMVLDGRILDGGSLRAEVAAEGVQAGEDAALLLEAWRLWGADALHRLRGVFGLAVFDVRDGVLHLARDRMGVRPLYYCWKDNRIAFASDPRALLTLDWVSADIAPEELAEFLSFRYTHAPRTLLRDIRVLPAGHLARVDSTGVRLHRWWAPWYPAPGTPIPGEEEVRDRVETTLGRAVGRRLRGEKKVGVLFSGGVASSSVLALARRNPEVDICAWTVALEGEVSDESGYGGRVARLFEVDHRVVRVGQSEFLEAVDAVVRCMGQPVTTPAAVNEYLLCRAAAAEAPVLLSGVGADEILGGPRAARLAGELRALRVVDRLPRGSRRLAHRTARSLGVSPQWLDPQGSPGLERGIGGSSVFGMEGRMSLLRDPAQVRPGMRRTMLEPLYNEAHTDAVNQVLHVYLRGWLAEDLVLRNDRVSALAGLELRYPMLDNELVSLCAGWPGGAKTKRRRGRWWGKWPLREVLEGAMPDPLIWRPDRGMPTGLNRWLRGAGQGFLEERIASVCEDPLGLFQTAWIREMARAHVREDGDFGAQLWTLIFFDSWWRSLR